MTKSLPISKRMVWNSYLKVVAKHGGAGIDRESIEMFNEKMGDNLYKLWNRMTSGSYFPPPVRTVLIPKKQGGSRPLGIPTVSDRIAQGVVKDYLEPSMETIFHKRSFGYRPGRSAHAALVQCQQNCIDRCRHQRVLRYHQPQHYDATLTTTHTRKLGADVCRTMVESRSGAGRWEYSSADKRYTSGRA